MLRQWIHWFYGQKQYVEKLLRGEQRAKSIVLIGNQVGIGSLEDEIDYLFFSTLNESIICLRLKPIASSVCLYV